MRVKKEAELRGDTKEIYFWYRADWRSGGGVGTGEELVQRVWGGGDWGAGKWWVKWWWWGVWLKQGDWGGGKWWGQRGWWGVWLKQGAHCVRVRTAFGSRRQLAREWWRERIYRISLWYPITLRATDRTCGRVIFQLFQTHCSQTLLRVLSEPNAPALIIWSIIELISSIAHQWPISNVAQDSYVACKHV